MLHRLPQDVLLRIVHMLCARAPRTDMTAAALALAQVSPYLRHIVARVLSHSLTLRFESDANGWAHVLHDSLRSLELLTFGSPRHLPAFRRLLSAPTLSNVRMPSSAPLLSALEHAPCVRSLFVTSFSRNTQQMFLTTIASLSALRELRIDSRTTHLSNVEGTFMVAHCRDAWQLRLLQQIAARTPRLHTLDIYVDHMSNHDLLMGLKSFLNLKHLVLRTTCSMYVLDLELEPIFLAMESIALHGFRHVPCLSSSGRYAVALSKRLVCASHLLLRANVQYCALRQFDTVVSRDEPLHLPKSLNRLALVWHDPFVPKLSMQALSPSMCATIASLPNLNHLVLVHVRISFEDLKDLLRALSTQLHTLSIPVALQGCAPTKRLLQLFQLCTRYCAELRELQVSELRCRNFSSCGPAASAAVQQVWPGADGGEQQDMQRLEAALHRLCRCAPYLDERPMRSVIRTMIADQLMFYHSVYAL